MSADEQGLAVHPLKVPSDAALEHTVFGARAQAVRSSHTVDVAAGVRLRANDPRHVTGGRPKPAGSAIDPTANSSSRPPESNRASRMQGSVCFQAFAVPLGSSLPPGVALPPAVAVAVPPGWGARGQAPWSGPGDRRLTQTVGELDARRSCGAPG